MNVPTKKSFSFHIELFVIGIFQLLSLYYIYFVLYDSFSNSSDTDSE